MPWWNANNWFNANGKTDLVQECVMQGFPMSYLQNILMHCICSSAHYDRATFS